jgi:hypothetical protein
MSTTDITSVFTKGVPLSLRTICKRTGYKTKYVIAITEKAIREGKLRRVDPAEVGSNRYNRPARGHLPFSRVTATRKKGDKDSKKKDTVIYHSHFTRIGTDSSEGQKEAAKKRKYFYKSRMNVFMLV